MFNDHIFIILLYTYFIYNYFNDVKRYKRLWGNDMGVKEYYNILSEITDVDLEVSSIADSRRLMSELKEIEETLHKLKNSVEWDIKQVKSDHTRNKRIILDKYSAKSQKSGITSVLRSSPRKKMIQELKRLGMEKNERLQEYHELERVIEDLIIEVENKKQPMNEFIRNRLFNS